MFCRDIFLLHLADQCPILILSQKFEQVFHDYLFRHLSLSHCHLWHTILLLVSLIQHVLQNIDHQLVHLLIAILHHTKFLPI